MNKTSIKSTVVSKDDVEKFKHLVLTFPATYIDLLGQAPPGYQAIIKNHIMNGKYNWALKTLRWLQKNGLLNKEQSKLKPKKKYTTLKKDIAKVAKQHKPATKKKKIILKKHHPEPGYNHHNQSNSAVKTLPEQIESTMNNISGQAFILNAICTDLSIALKNKDKSSLLLHAKMALKNEKEEIDAFIDSIPSSAAEYSLFESNSEYQKALLYCIHKKGHYKFDIPKKKPKPWDGDKMTNSEKNYIKALTYNLNLQFKNSDKPTFDELSEVLNKTTSKLEIEIKHDVDYEHIISILFEMTQLNYNKNTDIPEYLLKLLNKHDKLKKTLVKGKPLHKIFWGMDFYGQIAMTVLIEKKLLSINMTKADNQPPQSGDEMVTIINKVADYVGAKNLKYSEIIVTMKNLISQVQQSNSKTISKLHQFQSKMDPKSWPAKVYKQQDINGKVALYTLYSHGYFNIILKPAKKEVAFYKQDKKPNSIKKMFQKAVLEGKGEPKWVGKTPAKPLPKGMEPLITTVG